MSASEGLKRIAEAIAPNMRHLHYVDIEDVLDEAAGCIAADLKSAFIAGWLTRQCRPDVQPEEAWLTYLDSLEIQPVHESPVANSDAPNSNGPSPEGFVR
jgi:hypothetical protein